MINNFRKNFQPNCNCIQFSQLHLHASTELFKYRLYTEQMKIFTVQTDLM